MRRWEVPGAGMARSRSRVVHAARVAAVVAAVAALIYSALAVAFDVVDANRLVAQVDANLSEHLTPAVAEPHLPGKDGDDDSDVDEAPLLVWTVASNGKAKAVSDETPPLVVPSGAIFRQPRDLAIGRSEFRVVGRSYGRGWLVVGQSLSETDRVQSVVDLAEVVAGPLVVTAIFFVALSIGMMASSPVEQARRRQLEFTADASHELRTPLTVIEAEVGLALSADRDAASYREALGHIRTESKRLRRIVEDLLYLARSDATPPPAAEEPVDLNALAQSCGDRFAAIARARGLDLDVVTAGDAALVNASAEPLDRLCGVLVDNACRYTRPGGIVRVVVSAKAGTVSLVVQDSGPGLPADARVFDGTVFDRFRRGTSEGEGSGLGLAIADAVVKMTGGRWSVGTSPYGGAQLEVTWKRYYPPGWRNRSLSPGAAGINGADARSRARNLPAP